MKISLTEPMADWVQTRIQERQYASGSDYMQDLIRQDQSRSMKIETLQQAITEGLKSGQAKPFSMDVFKSRMMANENDG